MVGRHLILEKIATVDGRNWANQLRWVVYLLYPIILVVQEFFHEQYEWMVALVDI